LSDQAVPPQLAQLKSSLKAMWMAGDFGEIARYTTDEAEGFVSRLHLGPAQRVLDVACGTGNLAIPAARAGARVIGVDIAENLLEQARRRAREEKLNVDFRDGDAEGLPFADGDFDAVITMFGAMFAPRPDRAAAELLRVCKPGGVIAMANWTPEGFVGQTFRLGAKYVPPPPGVPQPTLWGDDKVVRQRLSPGASGITTERRLAHIRYPFPPKEVVAFFRQYFGPTQSAFSRLDKAGQQALTAELEKMWTERNQASDGTTAVDAEYLEVKAIRA
jgi:ubiquinone/menaquinone biosynthesis C-methylase UbiE